MSAQTIQEAFAPAIAQYKAEVMSATWGHLAPKRHRAYKGHVVFAVGCFGSDDLNPTVLVCEFGGLDDSPWLFDALQDFLHDCETVAGGVYRFDGTFKNYEFKGTTRRLELR